MKKKILIISGGISKERAISLNTGKQVAKELIKNSKVKLININNQYDLAKYTNQNIFGKKVVVAMGAGTISNWIREIPELLK